MILINFQEPAEDVTFHKANQARIITLNRPKALNALNLSMIRKIHPKLKVGRILEEKLIGSCVRMLVFMPNRLASFENDTGESLKATPV